VRDAGAREVERVSALELGLPFAPPFAFSTMLEFVRVRAIAGVERVRDGWYQRAFELGRARGVFELAAVPGKSELQLRLRGVGLGNGSAIVAHIRRVFDLDADSAAIDAVLARDPLMAPRVAALPGLRVPSCWDPLESAVRAVLGQQISVAAATTLVGRLAAARGERLAVDPLSDAPSLLLPTAAALATGELDGLGLTRARAAALTELGATLRDDPSALDAAETLPATVAKLTQLRGIGPWTAQYIALRGLGERDAFPASDLGLLRAFEATRGRLTPAELTNVAEAWRPYRAYAVLRLWLQPEPTSAQMASKTRAAKTR
jgi:AraC family transcriptional regulator, regulatory protein of adaptative response / DNA-3-methyladenine glycosylase II